MIEGHEHKHEHYSRFLVYVQEEELLLYLCIFCLFVCQITGPESTCNCTELQAQIQRVYTGVPVGPEDRHGDAGVHATGVSDSTSAEEEVPVI